MTTEQRVIEAVAGRVFPGNEISERVARAAVHLARRLDADPSDARRGLLRDVLRSLTGPGGGPPDESTAARLRWRARLGHGLDDAVELAALVPAPDPARAWVAAFHDRHRGPGGGVLHRRGSGCCDDDASPGAR